MSLKTLFYFSSFILFSALSYGDEYKYDPDEYVLKSPLMQEMLCTQYRGLDSFQPTQGRYGVYIKTKANTFTEQQMKEGKLAPYVADAEIVFFSVGKSPAEFAREVVSIRKRECDYIDPIRRCTLDEILEDSIAQDWLTPQKESFSELLKLSPNVQSLVNAHRAEMPDFFNEEAPDIYVLARNTFQLEKSQVAEADELGSGGLSAYDWEYDDVYGTFYKESQESEYPGLKEVLKNSLVGFNVKNFFEKAESARFEDGYETSIGLVFGRKVTQLPPEEPDLDAIAVEPEFELNIVNFGDCAYICKDCVVRPKN